MKVTESDIRHRGFVTEVKGTSLLVNIVSQSACASCHAKGACTVSDYQDKTIEITDVTGNYKAGQEVTVLFKQSKGFTAVIWGYMVPFFLVLGTLIAALEISGNELHAGLLSLAVLIPYYITLYFFRHHLKKVLKFEVEENV
uniref:SoxR reducing system RseC family protein n=1 Tax=uncultured Draconibacterium sp. TaxID=1573823 RepID=UPI003217AABE